MSESESSVFANAKPVNEKELADDEKAKESKATTESASKSTTARQTPKSGGAPAWHLSLTLGLVVALVGGLVLWMQSPTLALIVGGALVILVGLALALRHFFGARRRTAERAANNSNAAANGGRAPQNAANRDHRHTGPNNRTSTDRTSRRSPRTFDGTDDRRGARTTRRDGTKTQGDDRQRSRQAPQAPGAKKPPEKPAGGQTPPPGGRPPRTGDRNGPRGPQGGDSSTSGPRVPDRNGPRGHRGQRPRQDEGQLNMLGGSHSGISDRPDRTKRTEVRDGTCVNPGVSPTKPQDESDKPNKTRENETKDESKKDVAVDNPVGLTAQTEVKPSKAVEQPEQVPNPPVDVTPATPTKGNEVSEVSPEPAIEWPNVDLDVAMPLHTQHLPRITAEPKRPVKLPPQPKKEPEWPTEDPDVVIPAPRHPKGSATPMAGDMITRAQRSDRWTGLATIARQQQQLKASQAYEFLSVAGDLDGKEGFEDERDQNLMAAGRAAHDAAMNERLAKIAAYYQAN